VKTMGLVKIVTTITKSDINKDVEVVNFNLKKN